MDDARDAFMTGATGYMGRALAARVEDPASGVRVLEVADIRRASAA
jgi:thioester reductase-like protein